MSDEMIQQIKDAAEYTSSFLVNFLQMAAGLILFFLIVWIVNWLGGKVRRWFLRRSANSSWAKQPNTRSLVDNVIRLGIFVAGLMLALGVLGVSTDSLVTWVGVIVAALSLALQDIIKNLVAGFYLLLEQPFKPGDRLIVGDHDGYVETVALRVTGLRNARRQLVLVPNYMVFSQVVVNRTAIESHCLVLSVADVEGTPEEALAGVADAARRALGPSGKTPAVELEAIKATGTTVNARIWLSNLTTQRDRTIMEINKSYPKAIITVTEG